MNWHRPERPVAGWTSPVIYFVQAEHTGLIKIGRTIRLFERVRELAWKYGPVELLGWEGGHTTEERRLHWLFVGDWYSGEWFRPSDELVEFARAHGPDVPYLVKPYWVGVRGAPRPPPRHVPVPGAPTKAFLTEARQ